MHGLSLARLAGHALAVTWFLLAVMFMLGSAVYIGSPTVSVTNILSLLAFPVVCWFVFTSRPRIETIPAIVSFALLVILSSLALAEAPGPENLRLLRGVIVAVVGTFSASWLACREPEFVRRVVKTVLVLSAGHAALQGTFLVLGVGIDPRLEEQVVDSLASGVVNIGLPSFFGNPNNFSVFAGLTGIYFGVQSSRIHPGWQLLCLLCVLASGSRTVFVLSLAWSAIVLVRRQGWGGALIGVALLGAATVVVYSTRGESGLYVIDRTYHGVNEVLERDVAEGGSLNVRQQSHLYFATHYGNFIVGAFDVSRPFPAFRNTGFDDTLIRVNPHSLVIELHALFGVFGLLVLSLLAWSLVLLLVRHIGAPLAMIVLPMVALYSSVPSSVLQFHVYFVLVALITHSAEPPTSSRHAKNSAWNPPNVRGALP